jgi:hypothetical protein
MELGGYYPSKGEQSFGELRSRFYIEYSNALNQKLTEIWANNSDEYDNPKEVLADIISGNLEEEMMADNEVNPDEYDREEWIAAQEEVPEGFESDESDESDE